MIWYCDFVILTEYNRMEEEKVILVNERDEQIGLMPKMEAHQKAKLHRAFSVFVLNQKNELMLQQRALHKYHSQDFGPIPVVVIKEKEKQISLLADEGYRKKWDLQQY